MVRQRVCIWRLAADAAGVIVALLPVTLSSLKRGRR